MKLYENKKEIKLWGALKIMLTDEVPGHDFEYMVSFDGETKLKAFGKTWVEDGYASTSPKLWIHESYCPVYPYDDKDVFLLELFKGLNTYFGRNIIHVWENTKK
jgi:hypothetical protein